MNTLLDAASIVASGSYFSVILVFIYHGRKMRFSSSQFSVSEKSILSQFEVIFLNV